jgi:hypothetical protein
MAALVPRLVIYFFVWCVWGLGTALFAVALCELCSLFVYSVISDIKKTFTESNGNVK